MIRVHDKFAADRMRFRLVLCRALEMGSPLSRLVAPVHSLHSPTTINQMGEGMFHRFWMKRWLSYVDTRVYLRTKLERAQRMHRHSLLRRVWRGFTEHLKSIHGMEMRAHTRALTLALGQWEDFCIQQHRQRIKSEHSHRLYVYKLEGRGLGVWRAWAAKRVHLRKCVELVSERHQRRIRRSLFSRWTLELMRKTAAQR